jgi:hypothetical protein
VAFKMGMARIRSKVTGKPLLVNESSADDEYESSHD